MTKKPPRSGGRVTPKGTRPVDDTKARSSRVPPGVDHRPVTQNDPAQSPRATGPVGPTRAGHHRGQR